LFVALCAGCHTNSRFDVLQGEIFCLLASCLGFALAVVQVSSWAFLSAPLRIAAAASHRTRTSPCVRRCCVYLLLYNSACRSSSSHTLESLGRWHSLQALLFLFGLLSRLWLIPAALALLTLGCDGSLQEVRRHFVFWPQVSCSLAIVFTLCAGGKVTSASRSTAFLSDRRCLVRWPFCLPSMWRELVRNLTSSLKGHHRFNIVSSFLVCCALRRLSHKQQVRRATG
jgi:hypothetical protein